eukprot:TRINITY_DN79648_c0_g1_i1.p1 TRINITY_DN79648_c0_g1~~TRINITY_DN79648_c0_g1_i1.p1  ORF type:complete len:366 (+),score=59.10 TRINITY_DN79648_c0_g1_i1:41-1099(+)
MHGSSGFASIPPAFRQHAANLANWFPEVLCALGAPGLEDQFHLGEPRYADSAGGRSLEVLLQPKAVKPTSLSHAQSRGQLMNSFDRLATDFEGLLSQMTAVSSCAGSSMPRASAGHGLTRTSMNQRMDAAAEELLQMTEMLASLGAQASCSAVGPCQSEHIPSSLKQMEEQKAGSSTQANGVNAERADEATSVPKTSLLQVPVSPLRQTASEPDIRILNGQEDEEEEGFQRQTTPVHTPGSVRGVQAQQGGDQLSQPGAGRSRSMVGKASDAKNQQASLRIEVHKVNLMPSNEPQSPKGIKAPRIWGKPASGSEAESRRAEDACSMQARIERKLASMFGKGKGKGIQKTPSV